MSTDFQPRRVRWEVDFKGLMELLGKSLYTHSEVLVRELIQNAHDAIVMRREREKDLASRIDVQINARDRTLRIIDNGIGLDADDMVRLLSVIAATNKPEFRREIATKGRRAETEIIGQFGIGFLSVFVAAERVTVDSRKAGSESGYRWCNDGSIESTVSAIAYPDIGTSVEVLIKSGPEFDYLLDARALSAVIVKYMDFLQVPIHVNNQPRPVNTIEAPWDSADHPDTNKLSTFINQRFGDMPLDIISVDLPEPSRAKGFLYITDDRTPTLQTGGTVEILMRRVSIARKDSTFLPDWAKFVCGIIETPDLSPNAARDGLIRDDAFTQMQESLGALIIRRLTELAEQSPSRFEALADYHHYHLVGMAVKHDNFFQAVKELIPFQTNVPIEASSNAEHEPTRLQMMSLREYREKAPPEQTRGYRKAIYFTTAPGDRNQFNLIAGASGLLIINAPRDFDRNFLEQYVACRHEELELVQLDESMNDRLFHELLPEEQDQIEMLVGELQRTLSKRNLKVAVYARRFKPASIPAALLGDRITEYESMHEHIREIQGIANEASITSMMAGENRDRRPLKLVINYDSELIQKINEINRDSSVRREILLPLYNGSFLTSEVFLTSRNISVLHSDFIHLCQKVIDQDETASRMRKELSDAHEELRRHAVAQSAPSTSRRHIQLFMMTEYSATYDVVEAAARDVFESAPFFFEVRLARDYRVQAILHENIRTHIDQADGYIADISSMNLNVLIEIGAALFAHQSRPIYVLCHKVSATNTPIDISHVLRIEYIGNSSIEIAEQLKTAVAKGAEIEILRKARRERFLSGTVLKKAYQFVQWNDLRIRSFQEAAPTIEQLVELKTDTLAAKVDMPEALVKEIVLAIQTYAGSLA